MSEVLAGGRYKVVRRIAQGGMGEVLLADFPGDGQMRITPGFVVVKRVLADHPNRGHQAAMLREEGRVSLRLLHDNLVETFFVDDHHGDPLLVMEFLSGRAMSHVLGQAKKRKELVPVDIALALLRGAACGLHFAHTLTDRGRPLGLIHRDVSPANVFVTFDGRVKVIDFGVAKADDSEIRTSTGILKGKLGYMSPEHALGEKLTPAADLWSLGVLFWETLCAERLFSHAAPSITLQAISEKPVPLPTIHRPDLPVPVVELCMRLLERRLEKRIGTGAALVDAIDALPVAEAQELPRVDLGGWLSGRFPDEAAVGRNEAARAARMKRRIPVPIGLVEGTAAPSVAVSPSDDAPTLVMAQRDLLAPEPESAPDDVATHKMLARGGNLLADSDSGDPMRPLPKTDALGPDERDAEPESVDVDLATRTKPLPELNRPQEASSPHLVVPPSSAAQPQTASRSLTLSTTTQMRPAGSSWIAVACLTFGTLALAMGIAFSFLAPQSPARIVAAYDDGAGDDVLVAPVDAPPASRAVSLAAPEVKIAGDVKKLDPADLERRLDQAGVLARASLPTSTRGLLALFLPVLIAGLGLLALAAAVPALLVRSRGLRVAAQLALIAAAALTCAVVVKKGALCWPGLDGLQATAKLELKPNPH